MFGINRLFSSFILAGLLFVSFYCDASTEKKPLKTLIVDGQNNHGQWPKVTYMMKGYLEETGLFSVDVYRTAFTWKGENLIAPYAIPGVKNTEALDKPKTDPSFLPDFSKYDLVVCNFGWNAAPWPKATQDALEKFIKKGGGLVVIHAADNSFPEWLEYNKMIGLGGWGNRTEENGPYVYYNDEDELIRDMQPGKGGNHGPQSEFKIKIRNTNHPITKGMPEVWMHAQDELYNSLRGPAENMEVLATAYAPKSEKGTDRHEPMLLALTYGKGRIFHTPMGHQDYSVACVGFITSLQRGSEWAATGKVTIEIPADFPSADLSSSRDYPKE